MNPWALLVVAGLFEVGFTTALKLQLGWLFLICAVLSFELLTRAIRRLPLGIAYAMWTGIGAVGTLLVGALYFGESLSITRLALLTLLIAALIGIKLVSPERSAPELTAKKRPPRRS